MAPPGTAGWAEGPLIGAQTDQPRGGDSARSLCLEKAQGCWVVWAQDACKTNEQAIPVHTTAARGSVHFRCDVQM